MHTDLDTPENITNMVHSFYGKLLADPAIAPIFHRSMSMPIQEHLPIISLYWQKMLLGDKRYDRHTLKIHRDFHGQYPLVSADFDRWLLHFNATLEHEFSGPYTDKARHIAKRVIVNMRKQFIS